MHEIFQRNVQWIIAKADERLKNLLNHACVTNGIKTVHELVYIDKNAILKQRGFGATSKKQLKRILDEYGLWLGMTKGEMENYRPPATADKKAAPGSLPLLPQGFQTTVELERLRPGLPKPVKIYCVRVRDQDEADYGIYRGVAKNVDDAMRGALDAARKRHPDAEKHGRVFHVAEVREQDFLDFLEIRS